jgi:hypothetical protein
LNWFKESKTDIKPKNSKSSWVKGPNGEYDAVPRQYLEAKADKFMESKRKSPWDK